MLVIEIILKNKLTEQNYEDANGYNCLYYATYYGHLDVIKHLKSINVPYKKSKNGTNCLHVAVRRNYPNIVEYFLNKLKDSDRYAFIGASENNMNKVVEWNTMKRWEAVIHVDDQKNNDGIAPLHLAIKGKNLPIIKILRKYGADFTLPVTLTKG